MRRESAAEREAWTAHVEGGQLAKANKYGAVRTGKYPSKHQADVAANLYALERGGKIRDLREEVNYVLVPGNGKVRPIVYRADFVFDECGATVVADAKGYSKNQVYRLKKKLMLLLHGIAIREL